MKAWKIIPITAMFACLALLGGCSAVENKMSKTEWVPQDTTLFVNKDGSVTELVMDRLDQGYYQAAELEQMIQSSVEQYNKESAAAAITVDEFTAENQDIRLTMTYASPQDYADFNHVPFYNGSMLGAQMAGFAFHNEFRKVENGTVTQDQISNEEPLKHKECQVLVTDMSHTVSVPGNVRYTSINAEPVNEKVVTPVKDPVEIKPKGLVLPSSAVFMPEESSAGTMTAEQLEKTYLYIIYEF